MRVGGGGGVGWEGGRAGGQTGRWARAVVGRLPHGGVPWPLAHGCPCHHRKAARLAAPAPADLAVDPAEQAAGADAAGPGLGLEAELALGGCLPPLGHRGQLHSPQGTARAARHVSQWLLNALRHGRRGPARNHHTTPAGSHSQGHDTQTTSQQPARPSASTTFTQQQSASQAQRPPGGNPPTGLAAGAQHESQAAQRHSEMTAEQRAAPRTGGPPVRGGQQGILRQLRPEPQPQQAGRRGKLSSRQ